jgi:hypothetical protein
MLLSAVSMAMMFMATTETTINTNYRSSLQMYYASKAGLEEARDRLHDSGSNTPLTTAGAGGTSVIPSTYPNSGAATGVTYILNPDNNGSVQPWNGSPTSNLYFDDELCHENYTGMGLGSVALGQPCTNLPNSTWYTTVNSTDPGRGTSSAMKYKWVRITLKTNNSPYCSDYNATTDTCGALTNQPICSDNNGNEFVLPAGNTYCIQYKSSQPVYELTSLARSVTGAKRMTQYDVAQLSLPPLPAPLTMVGPTPTFGSPNSLPFKISGLNQNSCGQNPAPGALPAIGVDNQTDANTVIAGLAKPQNYVGVDCPTGCPTAPDVQSEGTDFGLYGTVGGLLNLVSMLTAMAPAGNVVGSNGTPSGGWGTSISNPQIVVVNGDYINGPGCTSSGYGIWIVTGDIQCTGGYGYNGLILLIGKGYGKFKGGGSNQINGGMLVANIYDHLCDGTEVTPCNSAHQLPNSHVPGAGYLDWSGGGGNGIYYDSCFTTMFQQKFTYQVIASREDMY